MFFYSDPKNMFDALKVSQLSVGYEMENRALNSALSVVRFSTCRVVGLHVLVTTLALGWDKTRQKILCLRVQAHIIGSDYFWAEEENQHTLVYASASLAL